MFKMKFEFKRGEEDCMALLNGALGAMRLSTVKIENSDGYLMTRTEYENDQQVSKSWNYGFDSIELSCEQDENEELCCWQLETEAFPKGQSPSSNVYHTRWCDAHPGRFMSVLQQISFDNAEAFVVLYHD